MGTKIKKLARTKLENSSELKQCDNYLEILESTINSLYERLDSLIVEAKDESFSIDTVVDIKNLYEKIMHEVPFSAKEVESHEAAVIKEKGNFDFNLYTI